MSQRLIGLSRDLERLRCDGYDVAVRHGYLVIADVPYVGPGGLARGMLISTLKLAGETTEKPDTHVCYWQGDMPCHATGEPLRAFENPSELQTLAPGLENVRTFSAKADYRDYHHKMTTYLARIVGEAQKLDPTATAQTFPVFATEEGDDSVFHYVDTASSRAGIGALNARFDNQRIAIIGLGGTGAYILDSVAKTQVREIHLFDGDTFSSHNAWRCPGAPSLDQLRAKPTKVAYLAAMYGCMRRGIVPHPTHVTADNVEELRDFDFVFVCVDSGLARKTITLALEAMGLSFIDVGLGVVRSDNGLAGLLRVTTSTGASRAQARCRLPVSETSPDEDDYTTNVQIAELNSLNANLAVLRWKRLTGFYRDASGEHNISFAIAPNALVNEDIA